MRALIIEDESAAAENLRAILSSIEPRIEVVAHCESVVESVDFLKNRNSEVDLIFMDIHLADGDAFKIFERVEVALPVIFTTAYDEYALKAFKVSSIDYLLKPIKSEEVQRALDKLQRLSTREVAQYSERVKTVGQDYAQYVGSFLVHVKDKIIPLSVGDIAYIYTFAERVVAHTHAGGEFPLTGSLDALYSRLDPADFYRANRQFIVSRTAVRDISVWYGSRLALNLSCPVPERIIIAKARTAEFKEWLSSTQR